MIRLRKSDRKLILDSICALAKANSQNGGTDRKSNIADAIEAILGAAWQDGGRRGAERFLKPYFCLYLNTLTSLIYG